MVTQNYTIEYNSKKTALGSIPDTALAKTTLQVAARRRSSFAAKVAKALIAAQVFWQIGDLDAAELIPLGNLPGLLRSAALDVSADGTVVVGYSLIAGKGIRTGEDPVAAFRWTRGGGMQDIGAIDGHEYSYARAISADGTTIVGESWDADECCLIIGEAFRWTDSQGMVGLGDLPGSFFGSGAYDVSENSEHVVGRSWAFDIPNFGGSTQAFLSNDSTEMVGLGPSTGIISSTATSISNDGNRVVGTLRPSEDEGRVAWLWDRTEQRFVELGLSAGFSPGRLQISGDGSTVLGTTIATDGELMAPYLWTEEGGASPLAGWESDGNRYATAISDDGSTVFGWDWGNDSNVIWNQNIGPRDLFQVLGTEHGLASDLEAWEWFDVHGMSSDGRTLVGSGSGARALIAVLDRPIHWIAGDADLDFDVDFADFLQLANGLGEEGTWENGDFDSDGKVQFADFLLLAGNFGTTPLATVQTVPEPSTSTVISIAIVLGFLSCRRHRVCSARGGTR